MQVPELEGQPLSVYFSLNQMRDLGIREGSELSLALRADRIRVFES
jgi:iron(III) transport system ATP-binding protein